MINIAALSTEGIIGFAVGGVIVALMVAWERKSNIKRLEEVLGMRWKMRVETIKDRLRRRDIITSEDAKFLLTIIHIKGLI